MSKERFRLYFGTISAVIIYSAVILVVFFNPSLFNKMTVEDGVMESLTAIFFLLTTVLFIVFLVKYKKRNKKKLSGFFTICWLLFTFLCFGEEISWGQRVFGFELNDENRVENYQEIESSFQNIQNETNLHNMGFVERIGNRVIIASIQLLVGLLFPILLLFNKFNKFTNKISLPLPSIHYSLFIVGGVFLIGTKLFYQPAPVDGVYLYDRVNEFSEMMMALGFFRFSLECLIYNKSVFE